MILRKTNILALGFVASAVCVVLFMAFGNDDLGKEGAVKTQLPSPTFDGRMSVEKALYLRRSVRAYAPDSLTLGELSQILWAAQGITGEEKFRTAPSAGALYPIALYIAVEKVETLQAGIYRYSPGNHEITKLKDGMFLKQLAEAALGQQCIADCAAALIIAANYERLRFRYRDRSERYAHIEAGHVSQNVYLQAVALRVGTVNIGAFHDKEVAKIIGLDTQEFPLCIMPLGKTQ